MKIPVYEPLLNGNEKKYVLDCVESNWISSKGQYIERFQERFAEYIGVKHAISVSNGTVALHLALLALGIGEGDEVIVPTFTYIASANAITYTGATPIFVDSLEKTWQMSPKDVERKITGKTKAIMVVHLYGHPCDMDEILAIAKRHDLLVIEDCAESFGSKYKNRMTGTFGIISAFSFYGNKTITCGEGGMVVTDDETLYSRAEHIKGQGLAQYRQYWHDIIGYNYRMTNMSAAVGLAQLERADEIIGKKRQIASWYRERLKDTPVFFHDETEDVFNTFWMCSILVPEIQQRDLLRSHLEACGIETRPTFYPIHTMPMYDNRYQKLTVAEDIGWRGMNLPSYPGLREEDVDYICNSINGFFCK